MSSVKIPLIVIFLQGIPELIALVTLAFVIARIPLNWKKIISIGIFLCIFTYIVRLFVIPFGIHTLLLLILLLLVLMKESKGDFSLSLLACLLSVLALAVFEFVCLSLLMPIMGLTPETMATETAKRIVISEPQVLLLFITAFLINKFTKKRSNA